MSGVGTLRRGAGALLLAALLAPDLRAQQARQDDGPVGFAPVQTETYDPEIERRTSQLSSRLRCPVCQGLSVEDSPTELAQQMRAVVREQLAEGRSPEQVEAYFVDKYGEWILLEPEPRGFNLLVYVLPWLAVALGALVVWLAVRRWTREPAADDDNDMEPRDDEVASGVLR